MNAAVIIPIFNEGERVIAVAEAAKRSTLANEVVVVNDGSTDNTAEVLAGQSGLTVLVHQRNTGKGEALDTGMSYVRKTGYDSAVFLDGDLRGLRSDHIDVLLAPLEEGRACMTIGYLGLRKLVVQRALLSRWGALSGQRALLTGVWDLLSPQDKHGFNIEAALNARLRKARFHRGIARVALDGVGHVGKREKEGTWPKAISAYARTYTAANLTYARIEAEDLKDKLVGLKEDETLAELLGSAE